MKAFYRLAAGVLIAALTLTGCGKTGGKREFTYPDFPLANADSDSWLQRGADDGITDVNWFVDVVGWPTDLLNGSSWVAKRIREKTGVNVNFISPLTNDGTQLNTLIAANKLPDVVTLLGSSSEQRLLSEDGYIYPINGLAERWAPTLLPRISPDITSYFAASDGQIYGLPNNFYTQDDMKRYAEQGGSILANGGAVARKDYLDAYVEYAAEAGLYDEYVGKTVGDTAIADSRAAAEYAVTRASNFLEMCKWVKTRFGIPNSDQTIMLSPWESAQVSTGSRAMKWLYEFFNVSFESEEGKLPDQFADPRLKEMTDWLNAAYRADVITNLGLTGAQVGTSLRAGKPFVFIGSPQDYTTAFAQWNNAHPDQAYVPVMFTNDAGETPQLTSLAGPGFRYSMITTNCARPDKVIKLFDYLWSEEGQRLVWYGIEGASASDEDATYYVAEEPSETHKYGKLAYTDWMQTILDAGDRTSDYGIGSMNLLSNRMFAHMTNPRGASLSTYYDYTEYNLKAAAAPFVYDASYMYYNLDPTDKAYGKMVTKQKLIYDTWYNDYVIRIIKAGSAAQATRLFEEAVGYVEQYGFAELLAYQNASFLKRKQANGVTYAHPSNRADSGYASLFVTSVYGDPALGKEIPPNVTLPS